MIIEACVENLEQAILAEKNGAHQIELCARLDLGGISPPISLVTKVLEHIKIPVKIMLRPRGGTFLYSENEMEIIQDEIHSYSNILIDGFVFGCLDHNSNPNLSQVKRICSWISGKSTTFHKAIDECTNILSALKSLDGSGVEYVLSSGGKRTAEEGSEVLIQMQEQSDIKIIAAGKITDKNLYALDSKLNLKYYHGRKIVGSLD